MSLDTIATVWAAFGGRDPLAGQLGVYKNLNARSADQQWSGKATDGPHKGLKVAEGRSMVLTCATPFVRQSTRQRILAGRADAAPGHKGHREVHAWITGKLADGQVIVRDLRRVTYHPFERGCFFYADTGEEYVGSDVVVFADDGNCYAGSF